MPASISGTATAASGAATIDTAIADAPQQEHSADGMEASESSDSAANLSSSSDDSLLATAPTQPEGTPVASQPRSSEAHSNVEVEQPLQLQLDQSDDAIASDMQQVSGRGCTFEG